jgi:hypothetical protein
MRRARMARIRLVNDPAKGTFAGMVAGKPVSVSIVGSEAVMAACSESEQMATVIEPRRDIRQAVEVTWRDQADQWITNTQR